MFSLNSPERRRFRMFKTHVLAFFKRQTYHLQCFATYQSHRCMRPNGHFGQHWCQCQSNDGTEWT